MKRIIKTLLVFYFFTSDFILFAQIGSGPGDEDNNGSNGLEGGDPPAATINAKLWLLLLLALFYGFTLLRKKKRLI
ncbi:hypothetical protein [Flavobacterium sp.]|jgi:hypothetical protein|uniref:hypothetical protein n=1 Tax=Flavobacterium sp. TaxID=239 RepID=UPI003BD245B2